MSVAFGLDLGGTKCLGVAVDSGGRIVAEERVPTPAGAARILSSLADVVAALRARTGQSPTAVGVGAPGLVDRDGVLHVGANLPGVTMLAIRAGLEAEAGVPVRVENDASCAAWGEFVAGAARATDTAVVVTQGTGIGGGIITGGALLRGAHGFAGEIGHMVVCPDGPPCVCGKSGCWERFASGSALGAQAREAAAAAGASPAMADAAGGVEAIRGEHVTAAAAAGDPTALAVLERFGWWVALGLANLAELVDPEVIVLAGGLAEAGDLVLTPTRAAFAELVQGWSHRPAIDIVVAELGSRAGAVGAAALVAP